MSSINTVQVTEGEAAPLIYSNVEEEEVGVGSSVYNPKGEEEEVYRGAILATMPLFMGYSVMVSFQSKLKDKMGIDDSSSHRSYLFGVAVSLIFLGELVFRLLHNIIFSPILPRHRVLIAYGCMAASLTILSTGVFAAGSTSLIVIFVGYILAGVAIGSFEANLLSCITPLGHATKKWAVLGMPMGYNGASIVGFLIFYLVNVYAPSGHYTAQMVVYYVVAACNVGAMLYFTQRIPNVPFEASHDNIKIWIANVKKVKRWVPFVWPHFLALCLNMFAVILLSSIMQYLYNEDHVPLWPGSSHTIRKNLLQLLLNAAGLLGDATSRVVAYHPRMPKVNPLFFLVLTAVAIGCGLSKVMLLAPLSQFIALFANGSIYATSTRDFDNKVDKAYNLIVLSVWLFCGDAGSFTAANAVTPLLVGIGPAKGTATPSPNGTMIPSFSPHHLVAGILY